MSRLPLRRTRAVLAVACALAVAAPLAPARAGSVVDGSPAARAASRTTTGLFGRQDPTYDGVYRQSLSLIALRAAGARVPGAAVTWLVRQQCPDGGFQAYRASLSQPCAPTDAANFSGEDTNSTALAALALDGAGRTAEARRARTWLVEAQSRDGGWGYVDGSGSDANSTGLVLAALRGTGVAPGSVTSRTGRTGMDYLRTVRLGCQAPRADRGALAFQALPGSSLIANPLASAQGGLGLVGSLPVPARPLSAQAARLACSGTTPAGRTSPAASVTGYLSRAIVAGDGSLPDPYDPSTPDWNATAFAVLTLVAHGSGRTAVATAMAGLGRATGTFVRDDGGDTRPAAAAVLVLTAVATARDPRDFGRDGDDLVAALLSSRQV